MGKRRSDQCKAGGRTNRGGAEAGEGSGEQRGQDTGAMEDKEDEGASSSDNLHQTVDFARAPAPAPLWWGGRHDDQV